MGIDISEPWRVSQAAKKLIVLTLMPILRKGRSYDLHFCIQSK